MTTPFTLPAWLSRLLFLRHTPAPAERDPWKHLDPNAYVRLYYRDGIEAIRHGLSNRIAPLRVHPIDDATGISLHFEDGTVFAEFTARGECGCCTLTVTTPTPLDEDMRKLFDDKLRHPRGKIEYVPLLP